MPKHVPRQYFDEEGRLIVKPYLFKDLVAIFDIRPRTLKRWMGKYPAELHEKLGKYYSVNQVKFLMDKIGLPEKITINIAQERKKAA